MSTFINSNSVNMTFPKVIFFTNRFDFTADMLALEMNHQGIPFLRFNTEQFFDNHPLALEINKTEGAKAHLTLRGQKYCFESVKSIWYRRPHIGKTDGIYSLDWSKFVRRERKDFLRNLYGILSDCFWVSKPWDIDRAEDKLFQLDVARKVGLKVPRTIATNNRDVALDFINSCRGNCIAKTLSGPYVRVEKQGYFIYAYRISNKDIKENENLVGCPFIIQEVIPRTLDIRLVAIGNRTFPIAIKSSHKPNESQPIDWRELNRNTINYKFIDIPEQIKSSFLAMLSELNLKFASSDLILTPTNDYIFLDLNPNGQWAWFGGNISEMLLKEMCSLLCRGSL